MTNTKKVELSEFDKMIARNSAKPAELPLPEEILFYGQSGSGKSTMASTIIDVPGFEKGLIIDTEGSTVGVVTDPRFDVIRVDQYVLQDDEGNVVEHGPFRFLDTLLSKGAQGLFNPENTTSYDVVILDTLDVAQDWAIAYYQDPRYAAKGKNGEVDGYKAWGSVANWTNRIAQGMKSMKPLGIIVLHDREEKAGSGALIKRLRLSGGAKDTLPGIPDVVAYLERTVIDGEPQTTAYFSTEDNKVTKNRFDKFGIPSVVVGASLPWFYQVIADHVAEGKKAEPEPEDKE